MKFVNIAQAKGLVAGREVYTLDKDGNYGIGKLVSRTEDAKGLHMKFEVPQYSDEPLPVVPLMTEHITHVCVMKSRNGSEE